MANKKHYHAFISYRHTDNKAQGRQWATWLHQAIETYEVPQELVGTINNRGVEIPAFIHPIFRDEEELPANADLGQAIIEALDSTHILLVLCLPSAVESQYVAEEIDYFKKQGNSSQIVAAIIDGQPNSTCAEDECFPLPLQFEYDDDGLQTTQSAELLAADFRVINGDGEKEQGWTSPQAYKEHLKTTTQLDSKTIQHKVSDYQQHTHLMLLKIIAGILDVPLGELTQRDKAYQLKLERQKAKRLRLTLAVVGMFALIAVGAGGFAFLKQQQAQALLKSTQDNLIFMNYELRDVLTQYAPTSVRVDILQKVDDLVATLQMFDRQDKDVKRERAAALTNKVRVILQSSTLDGSLALPLIMEAKTITQKLAKDTPDDALAQRDLSVLYIILGDVYISLGQTNDALEIYKKAWEISENLAQQYPDDIQLQGDLSAAYGRLGEVTDLLGQKEKSLNYYIKALAIDKRLAEQAPQAVDLQLSLAIAHDNLGDIYLRQNQIDKALKSYQKALAIDERLVKQDPDNIELRHALATSYENLGNLYLQIKDYDQALRAYRESQKVSQYLVAIDPDNIEFQRELSVSHSEVGNLYFRLGKLDDALEAFRIMLQIDQSLVNLAPENTLFLRDLSVSQSQLADLYQQLGEMDKALNAYKISLTLTESLVKSDPSNANIQRDIAVFNWKIHQVLVTLAQYEDALSYIEKARKQFVFMEQANILAVDEKPFIAEIDIVISDLKRILGANQ